MAEQGYLEGSQMANAFNMLRPNDLIWSYYVNNYLKGKEPMPFDLLVWNSDSTRMPAANHKFYLRHCYLQNDLSNGRMVLERQDARPQEGDDPGLRAGDARGPHRPCPLGVHRGQMLRRTGALRDGRLRPYRGRRQSARASRNISFGRAGRRRASSRPGSPRPRRRRAPGGPTGSNGSPPRRRRKSPPASPATAS